MKKLLAFLLLIFAFSQFYSCKKETTPAVKDVPRGSVYLVCGFDDAAENTDVLIANWDNATTLTDLTLRPYECLALIK